MKLEVGDPDAHRYTIYIDGISGNYLITSVDSDTNEYYEYDTDLVPPTPVRRTAKSIQIDAQVYRIDITK